MPIKTLQLGSQRVPKLRFGGFSGAWKENRLGKVADFYKGSGVSKDDIVEGGQNKCIRYGELYTAYGEIISDVKSRTNVSKTDGFLSRKGDIVIPSSGETALDIASVSCVMEDNILLGGDLNVVRLQDNQSGEFFAYYLTHFQNKNIAKLAQGNSVVHLYASHLKMLKVNLPSPLEQQKIADFLGGVDAWIENLRAQKESFESYKKGMMQKIFSQEIRFKDDKGNKFPEWEKKSFSDIFKALATKNYQIYNSDILRTGAHKVVDQSTDLIAGYSNDDNKVFKAIPVIIFGDHTTILKYIDFHFVVGADGTKILTTNRKTDNLKFLYYSLLMNPVRAEGYKRHYSVLKDRDVVVPSPTEQQKIAEFLGSIDKVLESKQQQITQTERWKKGLMQGLFV